MRNRRPIDPNSFDRRTQSQMKRTLRLLRNITLGGAAEELIDAFRPFAPVAGGMIGIMGPEMNGSAITHVVKLPDPVLESWATTPTEQMNLMMGPLVRAAPGSLVSDQMVFKRGSREELALLGVMHAAGFGEAAGYKVSTHAAGWGRTEHHFLTLALEDGTAFTRTQRAVFHYMRPKIEEALARMAIPLHAHARVLRQMVESDHDGFLCLSNSYATLELNDRAGKLIWRYLRAAQIEAGGDWFSRFVERLVIETADGQKWSLPSDDNLSMLVLSAYPLPKEVHDAGQDITLVMMRELYSPGAARLRAADLTARQRQIAQLLVTTELIPKQIAGELGDISPRTVEKHIEAIFRRCNVHSRTELLQRFR